MMTTSTLTTTTSNRSSPCSSAGSPFGGYASTVKRRRRYLALALAAGAAAVLLLSVDSGTDTASARSLPSSTEAAGHVRGLVEKAVAEADSEAEKSKHKDEHKKEGGEEEKGGRSGILSRLVGLARTPLRFGGRGDRKHRIIKSSSITTSLGAGVRASRQERPRMHTFYHRIDDGSTGMSSASDVALLTAWASSWYTAGWDPVILTMVDVRRHPQYETRRAFLEANNPDEAYNAVCFWRWFGMATVEGGGWMADYDVFPLYDFVEKGEGGRGGVASSSVLLPNDGNLTVHQSHVPALVSGREDEWDRMAAVLVERAERKKKFSRDGGVAGWDDAGTPIPYSDMHALGEMLDAGGQLNTTTNAILAQKFLQLAPFESNGFCDKLQDEGVMAVHFAHSSLKWAVEGPGRPLYHAGDDDKKTPFLTKETVIERRAEICEEWIGRWREACGIGGRGGGGVIEGNGKGAAKSEA